MSGDRSGHLGIGLGDVFAFQQGLFAALSQSLPGDWLIALLERCVQPALVEVALELGDVALLAVVAAHLVEDLDEHGQQRIDLGLADDVRFLVDVEQDAFGGDGDRSSAELPRRISLSSHLGRNRSSAEAHRSAGFQATAPASSAGAIYPIQRNRRSKRHWRPGSCCRRPERFPAASRPRWSVRILQLPGAGSTHHRL